MRKKQSEIVAYIEVNNIERIKQKFEDFNITYAGRIGVSSLFYKICLNEKLEEIMNNDKEFKRIAGLIIDKTGIGRKQD